MYNKDITSQSVFLEQSYPFLELQSPSTSLSQKNENHNTVVNVLDKEQGHTYSDNVSEKFPREASELVFVAKADAEKAENSGLNFNRTNPADYKCAMIDYPALECAVLPINRKRSSAAFSTASSKMNPSSVYDTAYPWFSQATQDNQGNFIYGLGALLHGFQLGLGPQPAARVALPNTHGSTPQKTRDIDYSFEGPENAMGPAEVYFPRSAAPVLALGDPRRKSGSGQVCAVKGQTRLNSTPSRERGGSLLEISSLSAQLLNQEALVGEARGYMQGVEFILNQLLGESDNGGTHVSRPSSATPRKVNAADLEALMADSPAPRSVSSTLSASNRRGESSLLFQAKGTGEFRRFHQHDEGAQLFSEKRGNSDMEYPAFDDISFRESLFWPESSQQPLQTVIPARRGKEALAKSTSTLEESQPSSMPVLPPRDTLRQDSPVNRLLGSMEYPSAVGFRNDTGLAVNNGRSLFPRSTCGMTSTERLTLAKASARELEGYEEGLRNEEQRIKAARRQAGDNYALRASRMVVMDNRFAPKTTRMLSRPNSGQIKREEAQEKENEERRARVQAFLEKRRAERARYEEMKQHRPDEEKGERPHEVPKRYSGSTVRLQPRSTQGTNPTHHDSRRKRSIAKSAAHFVAAPYPKRLSAVSIHSRESLKSPKDQIIKRDNHIHSLVIIHKAREDSEKPEKIKLLGDTMLEIQQGSEPPRFFEVDECLQSYDEGSLYSITLSKLRRMFLSGLNVSMCLAGSESVELLSWRPLREVMQGVFRDLGEDGQLFLSVALVQQGLTQDLLSESGRMVRTTFNQFALLDITLENVGYVKLCDLRHFSKLLAHGWEMARLDHTHSCGLIVVSVVLKQIKEDDIILSSMLVRCGSHSVSHLNSSMKRESHESSNLISAALGVSCFSVVALTLFEEDKNVVRLMNAQRKLASIVNPPGAVGSVKRLLKEAEKELAASDNDDPSAQQRHGMLLEQIAVAKCALMDPKHFLPVEDAEELKRRHKLKHKARLGTAEKSTKEAPHDVAAVVERPTSSEPPKKQQLETDGNKAVREKRGTNKRVDRLPSLQHQKKMPLPHTPARAVGPGEPPLNTIQRGDASDEPHSQETVRVVTALPSNAAKNGDSAVTSKKWHSPMSGQQVKKVTTSATLPVLTPVKRRRVQGQANSPKLPNDKHRGVPSQCSSSVAELGGRAMNNVEKGPTDSQLPPHAEACSSTQPRLLANATSIKNTERQLEKKSSTAPASPPDASRATGLEDSLSLSASVTVGATASTRYINRTDVPLQKPVFRDLEAHSRVSQSNVVTKSTAQWPPIAKKNSNPPMCASVEFSGRAGSASQKSLVTLITEQEEYVEEEEGWEKNSGSKGHSKENAQYQDKIKRGSDCTEPGASINSNVRTLVVVDPRCKETVNVTHDGTTVIVMTDDDFEEYDVDEVIERPDGCESLKSKMLDEVLETFMLGCNVAILAADSRSSSMSSFVLKSVVHDVLKAIRSTTLSQRPKYKGALSVSIVQVRGETVVDLLKENSAPQKLVIAISPIFGPCVHNVTRLPVSHSVVFDSMLTSALIRASVSEREYGMVFISFLLKQKLGDENDVIISSLVVNLVGENAGLYAAVLDRSPLVPRALFHYALGGPCYTLAVLGFSGDETRARDMLAVQRRLGEVTNRPAHCGSINKFINGIRTDLAPALREKLQYSDDRNSTDKILRRLEEMVRDAEELLENFDDNDPKAYLNDAEEKRTAETPMDRSSPSVAVAGSDGEGRVRSLVYFEQRLLGNGCIAVQDNSVLTHNGTFVCRYDVDEVVIRDSSGGVPSSQLIDDLVAKFLMGHNTALLAAESWNSAVTPLILRKIAYLIVYNIKLELPSTTIKGDLLVSMALVKDDVTVDLLAVREELAFHRFEVEVLPIFGRRLRGVSYHLVNSAEGFDHLLAVAVDRAEPALRSEDPGVMVVTLSLTQHVESPKRDVVVSSFMATTVFDSVSHYTGVLHSRPNEPAELFKLALGGPCYTIAMLGLCDDEVNAGEFLTVQMELAHVHNRPSHPVSVVQHVNDLTKGIAKLDELLPLAGNEQQREYISAKITQLKAYLHDAESLLALPVKERDFVPLGSQA